MTVSSTANPLTWARSLCRALLGYLVVADQARAVAVCVAQQGGATNMTDELNALTLLGQSWLTAAVPVENATVTVS